MCPGRRGSWAIGSPVRPLTGQPPQRRSSPQEPAVAACWHSHRAEGGTKGRTRPQDMCCIGLQRRHPAGTGLHWVRGKWGCGHPVGCGHARSCGHPVAATPCAAATPWTIVTLVGCCSAMRCGHPQLWASQWVRAPHGLQAPQGTRCGHAMLRCDHPMVPCAPPCANGTAWVTGIPWDAGTLGCGRAIGFENPMGCEHHVGPWVVGT